MHVIPQKSFIMALNISHDALDLQNVAGQTKSQTPDSQSVSLALCHSELSQFLICPIHKQCIMGYDFLNSRSH